MQRTLGPVERAIVKADQAKRRTCIDCRTPDQFVNDRGVCGQCFSERLGCPSCGRREKRNTLDGITYASCGTHIRIVR